MNYHINIREVGGAPNLLSSLGGQGLITPPAWGAKPPAPPGPLCAKARIALSAAAVHPRENVDARDAGDV